MEPWIRVKHEYVRSVPTDYRDRCLNIGCGDLRFTKHCGLEVGLDIDLREIDVQADFHHLPFRDESFGTVIAYDVIEHTTLYGLVLDEAHRVLRSGGYLVLATIYTSGHAVHADPQHVHCYTEELLRRALERHGFNLVRLERYCPERDNMIGVARKVR